MKKILFITHDCTLTGAPVLLLNLVKCLRNAGYDCNRVVVKFKNGALLDEFEKNHEVLFFREPVARYANYFSRKLAGAKRKLKAAKNNRRIQEWINDSDIVFSNTITNGDFFKAFTFPGNKKVISYVHELQVAAGFYSNTADLAEVIKKTNCFCVPANAVGLFLKQEFGVDPGIIHKLNYFIPAAPAEKNTTVKKNGFTIGILGTMDWRKGADVLPVLLKTLFKNYPGIPIKFLWKGVNKSTAEYTRIIYEIKTLQLSDKISFEENSKSVTDFYQQIDLLLLCSKEDPYPLVVLEAASFKKPCICFENAGGAPEFVQDDAGTVVPFLDIPAMAEAINNYYAVDGRCEQKGAIAYTRMMEWHANELNIQTQFNAIISS